jgi:hypothetical protein
VFTDTLPVRAKLPFPHEIVSIAPLLAVALRRFERRQALADLVAWT